MKKRCRISALLLALLFCLTLAPAASAFHINIDIGSLSLSLNTKGAMQKDGTFQPYHIALGDRFDEYWSTHFGQLWIQESDYTINSGTLPPGMSLDIETNGAHSYLYLNGLPTVAGDYSISLHVEGTETAGYEAWAHGSLDVTLNIHVDIGTTVALYDLWVDGWRVTSLNRDDVMNDGKVSYDVVKNELTIKGDFAQSIPTQFSGLPQDDFIKNEIDDLTVRIDGAVTAYGLVLIGADTTLRGNGSLTVDREGEERAVHVYNDSTLTVDTLTLELAADTYPLAGTSYESHEKLILRQVNAHLKPTHYLGVGCSRFYGGIELVNCEVTLPESIYGITSAIMERSNVVAQEIRIQSAASSIWVDGVQVSSENRGDILGNGLFSYDAERNTLCLKGDYAQQNPGNLIRSLNAGLTIETEGDVTLSAIQNGLLLGADTTLTGDGKLTIQTSKQTAIAVTNGATLTLQNLDLEARGDQYGLKGAEGGEKLVSNQTNFVAAGNTAAATGFSGGITLDAYSSLVLPIEGKVQNGSLCNPGGGPAKEAEVRCVRHFALKVCNVDVDETNMADPLGDGAFSFDGKKTLTVRKSSSCQFYVIENSIPGLTLRVENDVTLSMQEPAMGCPILSKTDMTITGPGKLTVVAPSYAEGISMLYGGTLLIRDANVTVKDGNWGISGGGSMYPTRLIIQNSTIRADAGVWNSAIYGFTKGIELIDCQFTEPEGAQTDPAEGCVRLANGVTPANSILIEPTGFTVSGTAAAWNEADDAVYLLWKGDAADAAIRGAWQEGTWASSADVRYTGTKAAVSAASVDGKTMQTQSFSFAGVAAGSYKLAVFKPGKYCPEIVPVTVSAALDLGTVKLWLYGDVTYDGAVNASDVLQMNRHISAMSSVFDAGTAREKADRLAAANVTLVTAGDGDVNASDVLQMNRYISAMSSAFDKMK